MAKLTTPLGAARVQGTCQSFRGICNILGPLADALCAVTLVQPEMPRSVPCCKWSKPPPASLRPSTGVERSRHDLLRIRYPHEAWTNISQLVLVKGEYRTSLIVEPTDGRMPLTQAGVDLSARMAVRRVQAFDHPEQRPLLERCMKSYGAPPMTIAFTYHQIVQTRDHVVIVTDGPVGVRVIPLGGQPPPHALRAVEGYPTGQWTGDTLVVQTTHLRGEDPVHLATPRPVLLSRHSRITERFTRVSETELFYQFTIDDADLYTQPCVGEYLFRSHSGPIFEFACHEGNYSLANTLSAARNQERISRNTAQEPK